ncbi:MAG: hypothetical protein M0Z46_15160 [Actinomycetota bacterium]|nr:hypothetical protein [Actinomycetota bacterium]
MARHPGSRRRKVATIVAPRVVAAWALPVQDLFELRFQELQDQDSEWRVPGKD